MSLLRKTRGLTARLTLACFHLARFNNAMRTGRIQSHTERSFHREKPLICPSGLISRASQSEAHTEHLRSTRVNPRDIRYLLDSWIKAECSEIVLIKPTKAPVFRLLAAHGHIWALRSATSNKGPQITLHRKTWSNTLHWNRKKCSNTPHQIVLKKGDFKKALRGTYRDTGSAVCW